MRTVFLADPDVGRRYVDAWAKKWERELRGLYGRHVAAPATPVADSAGHD
jgi:hypothetical protein